MSDNRSRHDRLAVRLSLIISRLMAGESLSLKTLSDEFGVTERTLQRDFHQRLVHLDLEYRNGRYSLRRQSSPGAIPEMLSFIQNTGIARILPLRNGRLITCLTDNQEPSPCLIWLPAPNITATFPECFSQLILAIRQCIHISLMTERWYPSLEPCRLIYYSGSWYLIALQKGEATSTVWSLKSVLSPPCHISLSSINLSTPLTCDRRPAKAVPTGMETIC